MPTLRKTNKHLPPCVYIRGNSYYYVKNGVWTAIGNNLQHALINYAQIISPEANNFIALCELAMEDILKNKSANTVKSYTTAARHLRRLFCSFHPKAINHVLIMKQFEYFREKPRAHNMALNVLNLIFQFALDRGIVDKNPADKVKNAHTRARSRLITIEEFNAIHNAAPDWFKKVLLMSLLTAQRINDVLSIKIEDLREDGIFFKQQKTNKALLIEWSPDLINLVKSIKTTNATPYLFELMGKPVRYHTVQLLFKKLYKTLKIENIRLHDIRALAATLAHKNGLNATKLLGHTNEQTTRIYLRDHAPQIVKGVTLDLLNESTKK